MYANNVVARRCFSQANKRIVIMANSNSADVAGARFMQALRDVSGSSDFDYFGYGGHRMQEQGLQKSEIDTGNFLDKTFYTWRKTKQITENHSAMRWTSWNLVNHHYMRNAKGIFSLMEDNKFVKNVYRHRPSLILSLDNEYFTFEIMKKINKYFENSSVKMPNRHYYNRFVKDLRQQHERLFDYMHYTIPKRTALPGGYYFPAQYVGQHGVYDTLRHLLANDPEQKHLLEDHHILLSEHHFAGDIGSAINKTRSRFREQHKIDEEATMIFFAPGNEKNEAVFSFESARRGVEEFVLKYSAPTSLSPVAKPMEQFHTVISLEEGSEAEHYIRQMLEERGWKGNYTIVTQHDNEYMDAMAASDLGIIYDGQMIGQAAACQLPTMILLEMRMHHQWYHDMFNRWFNSMVTIADKDIYPEIIGGQAWFGKICDTLGEWYLQPDTRYDMARDWQGFVRDAMHKVLAPEPGTVYGDNHIIFHDGKEYQKYADTFYLMAKKAWADIESYESDIGLKFEPKSRDLHKKIPNLY